MRRRSASDLSGGNLIEFAIGETNHLVLLPLIDDDQIQSFDELANLSLVNLSANATVSEAHALLKIHDDDLAQVDFKLGTISVLETNGPIVIEVVRTGLPKQEIRVLATARRTAQKQEQGYLFRPTTNELVFPPGVTIARFLAVYVELHINGLVTPRHS